MNMMNDRDILVGSQSWSATPWNYSSKLFLQFHADGTGKEIYGFGQTIYVKLNFNFELLEAQRLRLSYVDSPNSIKRGFELTDANRTNDLTYSLIEEQQVHTESITAFQFRFQRQLVFNRSPYPEGIQLPREVPLTYHGYCDRVER